MRTRRKLVRGQPVIQRTLNATLEELSRVGYSALRIEDVASRARVNKTTIYRRWPTKRSLVHAVLLNVAERHGDSTIPDTGSLRDDLVAVARNAVDVMNSAEGRIVMRLLAAEKPDSEMLAVIRSIQASNEKVPRAILKRARVRGELRRGVDPDLLLETLRASCDYRLMKAPSLHIGFVTKLVDLLLNGALSPRIAPRKGR